MTLGEALTRHRATCPRCTSGQPCEDYLNIARQHTARRQRYSGPRAASIILSVREDT